MLQEKELDRTIEIHKELVDEHLESSTLPYIIHPVQVLYEFSGSLTHYKKFLFHTLDRR
jgi:(p)ppGpp synthase/HD superfamily hydrolase